MTYRPGNEAVLEPVFFSAFWTPVSSLRDEEDQTRCSVEWVGSSATARAFLIIVVQSAERQAVWGGL